MREILVPAIYGIGLSIMDFFKKSIQRFCVIKKGRQGTENIFIRGFWIRKHM